MSQIQGAQIEFSSGTLIFEQGDPGGDLFFIKAGEVEVFREEDGVHVALATLKPGEVLGIMTCLTREPRLASARATTDVTALVVKQAGIKKLIESTPAWVNTVIKDFIVRVKNMDELYTHAMARLEHHERDVSYIRAGMTVATGLGELGALLAPPTSAGQSPVVDVDLALMHLSRIAETSRADLEKVLQVFIEVGLLKADPGAQVKKADLGVLQRLSTYSDFVRNFYGSATARQALETLTSRELDYFLKICEHLKAQRVALSAETSSAMSRLVIDGFPAEFVSTALVKGAGAGLLRLDDGGKETVASFVPHALATTVRSLLAVHKLRDLDHARIAAPQLAQGVEVISETF